MGFSDIMLILACLWIISSGGKLSKLKTENKEATKQVEQCKTALAKATTR